MSLIYGEKQDGISQAVRIDDAGRLVVIQAAKRADGSAEWLWMRFRQ